ncbi:MAG: hypothetical protein NMNS01_24860 [Nitrosomonas sp.]|nr:MAG: hypothetical protein NMNS01_24860 [Nitrosomonas sp.]
MTEYELMNEIHRELQNHFACREFTTDDVIDVMKNDPNLEWLFCELEFKQIMVRK